MSKIRQQVAWTTFLWISPDYGDVLIYSGWQHASRDQASPSKCHPVPGNVQQQVVGLHDCAGQLRGVVVSDEGKTLPAEVTVEDILASDECYMLPASEVDFLPTFWGGT